MIIEKSENEEWIFPLSIIHHFETMSRMDDSSRKKLAKVMGEVSKNYSIIPYIFIDKIEMKNVIYKLHDLPIIDFEENIITKDFARAVGLDSTNIKINGTLNHKTKKEMKVFAEKILKENNMFYNFMSQKSDRNFVTQLEDDKLEAIKRYKKIRGELKKIPKQHRYHYFIVKEFMDSFGYTLFDMKNELGVTKEELIPDEILENPESTLEFLETAPCFNVITKLTYQITKNLSRPYDRNDFNDMAFLATAIPYCDIVITEKSWVHHIKQTKLDKKYNTKVFKDIKMLLKL